jgi:cytochrome c oxidase assembly protein subunit 15
MNASAPRPVRKDRGLAAYAAFVVGFMVLVILEGAVVRATGSGNGCGQHWPLCNGQVLPHHPRLATVIEYTHRSLTGICTTLVAVLLGWTFVAKPAKHPARSAAVWTGVLLLTEGALGALLVLGGYVGRNASDTRVLVQSVHFTNTMLLLAAMTLTWWRLRKPAAPLAASVRVRPLVWLTLAVTMLTGATGSVAALADTLFPSPSLRVGLVQDFDPSAPLLIHMRWMHPAAAALSLVCALLLASRLRGMPYARWIAGLALLQLVLGLADIALLTPTTMQVLHLLGADLFWIAMVATANEALRRETVPAR